MTPGSRRTRRTSSNSTRSQHRPAAVRLLVLAILVMSAGSLHQTSAAAQPSPDGQVDTEQPFTIDPSIVSLEIADQSTFVAADGALGLDLAVSPADQLWRAADQYELSVTLYGLIESESEVDEPLSRPLNRLPPIPLHSIGHSGSGVVHLDIPIRSGSQFDEVERVLLPQPGVYPISIELRTVDGPIASARTHVIRLPQVTSEEDPTPVALVLNVSTAEGLTVSDVQQLLIDHPTTPLTVVLQEGVTNLLNAEPELAAGFVAALAGRPVLAVPPIDLDPSALSEIDQAALFDEARKVGDLELRRLGMTVATDIAVLGAPLTDEGAELLAELGMRSVLDTEGGSAGVWQLGSGRARLQVIRIDRGLSRILGGGDGGPHRANRILAKLTLRGEVDDAPVVLGGASLGVDPGRSIDAFLRALNQPGAPRPILLSDADGGPPIRVSERPDQDLRPIADLLVQVQTMVATYEGFHNGGGNTPAFYRQQILASLTRQRNPDDRRRALTTLVAQMRNDMGVVQLHEGQPVTLAAREAPIPILMDSDAVGPRNVMLRFDSDKVVADHDKRIVTIEPGTSSINVELQARSLGVSPLEVSVWTPDGETQLAATRFEIRSTAIPGLGLLVSIGAVGLLGAWWVLDARKRRDASVRKEPMVQER